MRAIEQKSRLKHIAHNPSGELVRILTQRGRAWLRLRTINRK
jgi:hypothetical protein